MQAINRLADKVDQIRREQQRATDSLRQEIGDVRQKLGGVRQELGQVIGEIRQDIHDLDAKFEQKLSTLPYRYWGTLGVLIFGVITLLFTHPSLRSTADSFWNCACFLPASRRSIPSCGFRKYSRLAQVAR